MSHLMWNPSRQHAAAATRELTGNVSHNAEHSRRTLVVGSVLRGTLYMHILLNGYFEYPKPYRGAQIS